MTRRPVAKGSNVPAWPMRFIFSLRLKRATTSWDVQPLGLSTSKIPSKVFDDDAIIIPQIRVLIERMLNDLLMPLSNEDRLQQLPQKYENPKHKRALLLQICQPNDPPDILYA